MVRQILIVIRLLIILANSIIQDTIFGWIFDIIIRISGRRIISSTVPERTSCWTRYLTVTPERVK